MVASLKNKPKCMILEIKQQLNLSEEESEVFDLAMRKKSIQQIADDIGLSARTVSRRIHTINTQIGEVMAKTCR